MRYLLVVSLFALVACAGKVRFDGAPAPRDLNQHTLLLEADCGDGNELAGFGQIGCSWGADELVAGRLTVHTPLPGAIALYSHACGIDKTDYHGEQGGSFQYPLAELMPAGVAFCIIDVFVRWELPPKLTSDYPLRGMTGRVYLRRRHPGQDAAALRWTDSPSASSGIAWGQFRSSVVASSSREPVALELEAARPLTGAYRLFGCGNGVETAPLEGAKASVARAQLLGPAPKKGSCTLFGWLAGKDAAGKELVADAVAGVEVFDSSAVRLAVNTRIQSGKVCYEAEAATSLAVLVGDDWLQGSNKLRDCLKLPADGRRLRLGFFTHQGRAAYAILEGGNIVEVLQ